MKVLKLNNPNAEIFSLEKEEGGDSEDHYFGSIGDSTLKHIQKLNSDGRQLWEELIHMKNGAIFRMVPNWDQFDRDPFNLKGKDLDKHLDKIRNQVSKSKLDAIKEAFEVEQERRNQSEDVLDCAETISFEDWQQNPGLWSSVDLPKSPKDRFIYMGNSTQAFYDYFPEGHPDEALIQKILLSCDREWNSEDSKYATWLEQVVSSSKGLQSTKNLLIQMIRALVTESDDSNSIIETYLSKIDEHWGKHYRLVALKSLERNDLFQLLIKKEADLKNKFKEQSHSALSELRRFGNFVYKDKELRTKATSVFWAKYRELCVEFAPQVNFQGLDINRANLTELCNLFHLSRNEAINIWHKRPFLSIDELYFKQLLTKKHFSNNVELVDKVLLNIEKKTEQAIRDKNLLPLSQLANALNSLKNTNRLSLSEKEWQLVWIFYNIQRNHFRNATNDKQKGEENV